ncbi:serine hydrolase domain-containing protein [Psychroserpens ponticola]|uniref:Serine hydrolase n=1 Tax=Psychroserpens ponticola TaxID=2932268 RepID=A0ABY7RT53_9FLAO|nr:serine hydrolase domain-containing protein [Psychroserpens ponticola]WCO00297.1 serine hydrolase [Psychroserpens ponticola]
MHKKQFGILIMLVFLFPKFGTSQNIESKVDSLYQVNESEPGFSIAIFKGNEIILEKQYGNSNLDYNIPITNETVFDIGSIAKQFTAAAILLLEKEGKLSIKEPAYKYIDNLTRYKKGDPTIEQLLNQTSGIQEVDPYLFLLDLNWYDLLTQSQMINIITKQKELNFSPGEYFQYTNANYILLANIIEKTSEKSFPDYLEKHIFLPLGMKSTTKKNSSYSTIKNRAVGYIEDSGIFYKTDFKSTIYNGDGQVLTSPRDMFKWHQNIKNATIGTSELWKKMHTKGKLNNGEEISYGLGVEFETHKGYKAMGFDGMIQGGFVSKYLYFPELDIAFFTTQNIFDWDFRERFFQLVDLYIPKKESINSEFQSVDYKEIKLPKTELKKYEGTYIFLGNEEESIKINTIKLIRKKLIAFDSDGEEISELKPIGNQKFIFFSDKVIEFTINEKIKEYKFSHYPSDIEAPWVFKEYKPYNHTQSELKEFEGQYFNANFQIGKKIKLENNILYFYHRNGAWKTEIESVAKDILEIQNYPIELVRYDNETIKGIKIMGLLFKKIK